MVAILLAGRGMSIARRTRNPNPPFNPAELDGAVFYVGDSSDIDSSCAASWTTTGQYLSCADNPSNDLGDFDWWWAGWAYITDDSANRTLFSKQPLPISGVKGVWILFNATPNDRFLMFAGNQAGTNTFVATTGGQTLNAWHFVMAYHDSVNNVIGISVDGASFATTAFSAGLATATDMMIIGSEDGSAAGMQGRMQGVCFGKQPAAGIAALSTTIRDALYNSGNGVFFGDLVPQQILDWGLESFYDFSGPKMLVVDRLDNSNLTNTGPVVAGTGHVTGSPTFLNDAINQWDDQTANNKNLVPTSLAGSPGFAPADLNGLSGITFDGSTEYMTVGSTSDWKFLHDGTGMTLVAVVEATADQDGVVFATQPWTGGTGILIYRQSSGSNLQVFINNGSGAIINLNCAGFALNTPLVLVFTFDGTTCNAYINGSLAGTAAVSGSPSSSTPTDNLTIGAAGDISHYFGGKKYAIEGLNRVLSAGEIATINDYLLRRFGLNVPTSLTASNRQLLSDGTGHSGFNYTAFPVSTHKMPNGDLLTVYFRGSGHDTSDGVLEQQRSTNLGVSWSGESVFIDNGSGNAPGGATFTTLANGTRVVGTFVRQYYNTGLSVRLCFWYSDDSGVTWSSPVDISAAGGFTSFIISGSRIVELTPGGRLVFPIYGQNTGDQTYVLKIIYSDDGGTTWALLTTVTTNNIISEPEEPQLGMLHDGRLMMLIRDDPTKKTYITYSSDGGSTWTPLAAVFSGFGWPRWTQLTNGSIFVCTRHSDPLEANQYGIYRLSWNNGQTWGPEQKIDPSLLNFYLYGAGIEISPNVIGLAWACEQSSTQTKTQWVQLS